MLGFRNPHNACGTAANYPPPRFRALVLFGRRPPVRVAASSLPATENLHNGGHSSSVLVVSCRRTFDQIGLPSGLSVDAKQQPQTNGPFLKIALILWVLALCGVFLVLPYVVTLENKALAAAAARTHLEVRDLLAISVAQTAVLLAIAVVVGQWAARKLGLGTPLIAALLTRRPAPEKTVSTLLIAVALGIVTALALMMLDHWVFAPIPSIAKLIQNAESGSAKPSAWQGLLASFYGALDEEILMRLGLMSLLALAFRTLARIRGANCELMLPTGVFWAANILAAVLFGLGHLPATAALAPLSVALVVRAVVLNGTVGLVFGALYRRYGLEWAIASHFSVDIVAHVVLA